MAKIPLTNRRFYALVDDEDLPRVEKYRWRTWGKIGFYVRATKPVFPKTHQQLHRLIMRAEEGQIIDHINGNPLDNRKSNLRICSPSINSQNRHTKTEVLEQTRKLRRPKYKRNDLIRRPDRDKPTKAGLLLAYSIGNHIFYVPEKEVPTLF